MKHTGKLKYILPLFAWICTVGMQARDGVTDRNARYEKWGPTSDHNGMGYTVRAGFVLGGTTPLPLPAEVRSIGTFKTKGGLALGLEGYKYFNQRWGLTTGLHFFMQGMQTGAEVKDYNMALIMGEDKVEGHFTGTDITITHMTGFTVPVMATYRIGARWNFNLGPYFSYWIFRDFEGEVYDGYLREGSPTGQKIAISRENPASYSFSDDMRRVSWGFEFCADFRVMRHMNVFGLLDWGLSDVFKKDFKTVSFPMYPLYATFGLAYYY